MPATGQHGGAHAEGLVATVDPYVYIEHAVPGYTRYQQVDEAGKVVRRWEVAGTCDRRGDCLVGAVVEAPDGTPVQLASTAHIAQLANRWGRARIDTELDVPVTPEFDTCCGADRFTYTELPVG